ncbi:phospholipase A2 inhibitor and Ly6/PLAUR domain-containing protein-like [Hyperolius riggenbachi]|uniref:phospholipase A2 inhibitor and Ly6/PLAUR domain-containing protein-like n=1 Tax=Hyperolius riggenbachi TaxID=752182 RepID=UPI0035A309EE
MDRASMKTSSLLGMAVVLLALVLPGHALVCKKCASVRSTSCTGRTTPCPYGSACTVSYALIDGGDGPWPLYALSCGPKNKCGTKGSASMPGGGTVLMATSCCTTDNCIPDLPSLPVVSPAPNGLMCPSCVVSDADWCKPTKLMHCKGNENMCILEATRVTGAISMSSAVRGCATPNICELERHQHYNNETVGDFRISCKKASVSESTRQSM